MKLGELIVHLQRFAQLHGDDLPIYISSGDYEQEASGIQFDKGGNYGAPTPDRITIW